MPTETSYGPYTTATMPVGNGVHPGKLQEAIEDPASGISVQVKSITKTSTTFTVTMKDVLSAGEKTTLDGGGTQSANDPPSGGSVIGDHDGTPPVERAPKLREDDVAYAVPKAASYGYEMCDRDFRINTGVYVAADSFEDVKIDPATLLETPWGELEQVGVYKDVSGTMTACDDQADVDANGILSVWQYCAKAGGNPIHWEVRDGAIYVDPTIHANPDAPTLAERFDHRVYAIFAPDIPGNQGGSVAVFDGYMGSSKGLKVVALSPQASILDPDGPGGVAGAIVRLYLYYPVGTKLSHVMRLVTYRALGTF
jgi:hypothetical protein